MKENFCKLPGSNLQKSKELHSELFSKVNWGRLVVFFNFARNNRLFAKKMSFVFSHRNVNMIYKRVCRNGPISSCGAKYLVKLR